MQFARLGEVPRTVSPTSFVNRCSRSSASSRSTSLGVYAPRFWGSRVLPSRNSAFGYSPNDYCSRSAMPVCSSQEDSKCTILHRACCRIGRKAVAETLLCSKFLSTCIVLGFAILYLEGTTAKDDCNSWRVTLLRGLTARD